MATKPNTTGAPSGASNVVRLPTAAALKVNNNRYRQQRVAAREARDGCRWEYVSPARREKLAEARTLGIERTPATLLLLCLLKHSAPQVKAEVLREVGLAWLALPEDEATYQAYSIAARLCGEGL